jgi:hypothetical protein
VYSCSEKKIRVGFDLSDRTIPLSVQWSLDVLNGRQSIVEQRIVSAPTKQSYMPMLVFLTIAIAKVGSHTHTESTQQHFRLANRYR